jgi:hypothetical protein
VILLNCSWYRCENDVVCYIVVGTDVRILWFCYTVAEETVNQQCMSPVLLHM